VIPANTLMEAHNARKVATLVFLNETVVAIWGENEGRQEGQVTGRRRSGVASRVRKT
jgi:hypothetical protein